MNTYQCPHCPYQKDLWSVKRHMSRKHMNNQAGSGALEREQVTAAHMQEASAHQQNVAISDKIENLRQLQVAYQNVLTRNKQLEAEKAEIEKWRNEKIDFEVQREKEIVKLKSHLERSHILIREISTVNRQLHAKLQLSEC